MDKLRLYYHSSGKNYRVVMCKDCGANMEFIYDPGIRDCCIACGGDTKGTIIEAKDGQTNDSKGN
jgi:hypothetical protein